MINIEYQDISLTAKNDSTITCTDKQPFSNLNQLKQTDLKYKKFTTLEKDFWKLDGTFNNFPDDPQNENIGLCSQSLSDENGNYTTPVIIQIDFNSYETSVGITLNFNTNTNDYPTQISLKWYQDSTLLSEKTYTADSAKYFCENSVSNFNKLIIECQKTNRSYRYLKLQDIIYGLIRNFNNEELRSVELLEDISLTSEELRINTLDFTINNKKLIDFIFQKKQPLKITRNDELLGVYFIDTSKRKSKTLYEINAIDYIGVMDKMVFAGGTYTNETVSNLVSDIMGNIPYELDPNLKNKTLSGTLEPCTRREALLQVAFACCAIVDTSRSKKVNIFKANTITKSTVNTGIYQGGTFEKDSEITEIRLVLNNDTVVNKRNSILGANVLDNILEFSGVFVDNTNAQEILNYLYDYYVVNGNSETDMKFIVTNQKCGDVIEYSTEYLGNKKGQITQMKFSFNSLKFVAKAKIKELV